MLVRVGKLMNIYAAVAAALTGFFTVDGTGVTVDSTEITIDRTL